MARNSSCRPHSQAFRRSSRQNKPSPRFRPRPQSPPSRTGTKLLLARTARLVRKYSPKVLEAGTLTHRRCASTAIEHDVGTHVSATHPRPQGPQSRQLSLTLSHRLQPSKPRKPHPIKPAVMTHQPHTGL